MARRGFERPLSEPGAAEAAVAHGVQRFDELVALTILAEGELAAERAIDLVIGPWVKPDRHALVYVRHLRIDEVRACEEERKADRGEQETACRNVEHCEEDPVVEERRAEVVGLDEDEHRAAPDDEQRPEVLQPSLRKHLALLAEVAGEEDDQAELRDLAWLELKRAEVDPEPGAVDGGAEPGQRRKNEQPDCRQAEDVLVALQPAVVASKGQERACENRDR